MKRFRIAILFILLLQFAFRLSAQVIPPACTESWVRYAPTLDTILLGSHYNWIIPSGGTLGYTMPSDGDSIDIHWGSTPGKYQLGVSEVSIYGCVGDTFWTTIDVKGAPINLGPDLEKCQGDTFSFDAGMDFISYKWNNNPLDTGRYFGGIAQKTDTISVFVVNQYKCHNSDTAILTVHPLPTVNITDNGKPFRIRTQINGKTYKDTMLCGDQIISLDAGNSAAFYEWSTNDTIPVQFPSSPLINIGAAQPSNKNDSASKYVVTASSDFNCKASDSVYIQVCTPPSGHNTPTVFTPNGDGINETWEIPYLQYYPNASVEVYDRWGRLVFHSTGYPNNWDGKSNGRELPMDTYFFIIKLNSHSKPWIGNVTILR